MLRRQRDHGGSHVSMKRSEIEMALSPLVWEPPHAAWAALVSVHGRLLACFPSRPAGEEERISAMCAAIVSLGERICRELGNGELRYGLLAGANGATLVVGLDRDRFLTLALPPGASVDTALAGVRGSGIFLMQFLGIPDLPV